MTARTGAGALSHRVWEIIESATAEQRQLVNVVKEMAITVTCGAAHLCVVDPRPGFMSSREGLLTDFLASYPPVRQQILQLKGMSYQRAELAGEAGGGGGGAYVAAVQRYSIIIMGCRTTDLYSDL